MARIGASGTGGASSSSIAAGNDTDVQFNNSGVLGGNDNFTFDGNFVYGEGFLGDNNLALGVTLTIIPTKQLITAYTFK